MANIWKFCRGEKVPLNQFVVVLGLLVTLSSTPVLSHVCRDSINATNFGWQLNHLARSSSAVEFYNRSFDLRVDDTRCDIRMDASPSFLNERSLCPWDLVQDINNNRYPHVLNFARCRCSRCLGEYGIFHCKPLTYRIPVLEKVCINGEYEYIKTYLDVPVGCICARPNVVRTKKIQTIKPIKTHWRRRSRYYAYK